MLQKKIKKFKNIVIFSTVNIAILVLCGSFAYIAITSSMHTYIKFGFSVICLFVLTMYIKNFKKMKEEHFNV